MEIVPAVSVDTFPSQHIIKDLNEVLYNDASFLSFK